MNRSPVVCVPEHAVAQNEVVGRVKRRLVVTVVVGMVRVVEGQELSARRHIINLRESITLVCHMNDYYHFISIVRIQEH